MAAWPVRCLALSLPALLLGSPVAPGPGAAASAGWLIPALILSGTASNAGSHAPVRRLTFEERVAAQAAIERVYYRHQIGTEEPFETAVPRAVLEAKVRTYLEQSTYVESALGRTVTVAMLADELERLARETRFPDRLLEIHTALGNDAKRLQECFARPVLVARLLRAAPRGGSYLPANAGLTGREEANAARWAGGEPDRDESLLSSSAPTASGALESFCIPDPGEIWSEIPAISPRAEHTGVWTGSLMIVWGGVSTGGRLGTGERYDPITNLWTPTSVASAPTPRDGHTAVWTGSRMVVWGGYDAGGATDTGGRYDPIADAWTPTAGGVHAPAPRRWHSAVWTGSEMIIWGGEIYGGLGEGGRYDPIADRWKKTKLAGAPSSRMFHPAVWTGTEMIVWGGSNGSSAGLDTGGRYNPANDTWAPISMLDAPAPRYLHSLVWTGHEAIVWGGWGGWATLDLDTGGRYDPATDSWQATATTRAPVPRDSHSSVWTGAVMIVVGGAEGASGGPASSIGGQYDPLQDLWVPMTTEGMPGIGYRAATVWTGSELLLVGGRRSGPIGVGARYSPGGWVDADGDGHIRCGDDCDDADPATYEGAVEICDRRDNDCDGALPPDELDLDGDSFPVCAECDDSSAARFPGNPETCDGLDNDCDLLLPVGEVDGDGDGFLVCAGDCDDGNPLVFPGDVERNDGVDNQCPGESGLGLVDEISGIAGFLDAASPAQFCWPLQAGATEYEMLRSEVPSFSGGCAITLASGGCASDPSLPASRAAFYYLVRATAPYMGSLGRASFGAERQASCGSISGVSSAEATTSGRSTRTPAVSERGGLR